MPGKVLILAGAPESSSLNWDSSVLLLDLQQPFARLAAGLGPSGSSPPPQHAAWRSLPLERSRFRSGFSQARAFSPADQAADRTHFFTPPTFASEAGEGTTESDLADDSQASHFYEHSLAIHDGLASSQLPAGSSDSSSARDRSYGSVDDTSLLSLDDTNDPSVRAPLDGGGHLSDLEDVPTAAYLLGIHPQTVTVNLIVGVISVSPPRSVRTRWGSSSTLVEVLVGDETRSGFAVTFWLRGEGDTMLAGMRPGDVVLMRNVGLNVFSSRVYGSSLRRDLTRVHLLYRKRLDAVDAAGHYTAAHLAAAGPTAHPQLHKTKRVREWVLQFIGGGAARRDRDGAIRRPWDQPPVDTQ